MRDAKAKATPHKWHQRIILSTSASSKQTSSLEITKNVSYTLSLSLVFFAQPAFTEDWISIKERSIFCTEKKKCISKDVKGHVSSYHIQSEAVLQFESDEHE